MGRLFFLTAAVICAMLFLAPRAHADDAKPASIKALIVDGQNNHEWKKTTPVLKAALVERGVAVNAAILTALESLDF